MEFSGYDIFAALMAGISLGAILGHWLSKQERRMEYERGKLDGINMWWSHYERSATEVLLNRLKSGKHKATGSDGGSKEAV